ncbi:MAG TPA: AAA family ATPase [Pyrinomonadaceae bacterium]
MIDDEDLKKRAQAAVTFARQNASAREAVVDKRNVMVDALRRNLTFTTHEAIVQELDQRVQSGEFIAIQRFDRFEELTTSHMLALERSNIHQMLAGRNTQEPMMQRKEASRVIKEIVEKTGKKSSFDQYKAVGQILVSRDRVFALEGLAGTGKTTTLAILREALERQGFAVRGLAPTGRAADKLAESGIRTTTLQGFLKSPELTIGRDDERSLYVLDESSLSDTKNLHLFLKKAGLQSRILLVGDPAQHQAVEAGAPFEQLLKAGIRFARLDKILRQQSNLKKPVELLSKKEAAAAVALLETQGRITEITDDIDRLKAIATDYVNNPKSTLIISPANSERVAINNLIHHKLQQRGTVGHENHRITVLVNRQDMTGPERTFALAYVPGEDIIRYNTTSKLYGVKSGDYGRIKANDHKENTITVRFENGRELTYNPERLSGVSVYREAERDFAVGDRVQFRAPFSPGKVKNSELGTVKEITDDEMIVRLDKKRDVAINLTRFRHLDHGYAVTSHSSQGQTVNRVLVNAETSETELLVNQRMAYVAISRARFEARVYTDSLKDLGPAFNREKNKEIAIDALKQSQSFSCAQQSLQTQSTASTTENLVASQNISTSRNAGKEKAIPFSERMRDLNHRLILGERLSASLNEKYAAEKLEQVLESRNVRRYLVMDQTIGLRRELSIHDVERRAMSVAGRVAEEQVSALDGSRAANMYRWKELRALEYANQIEQHHSTINEIHEAHEEEVRKLTQSLQGARQINLRATLAANSIESSIQSNGQSPLPIIPHERLNELQQSAIRYRDVDEFKVLEKIRDGLPHELGGLGRDDYSFARLKGQALVADSNVRVAEKRIEEFEKTRHFAKFEIDGEEWSLVRIDRATRLAERQIEFHRGEISSYRWRIYGGFQNPWKLRNIGDYRKRVAVAKECIATACNETRDLQPIREEVLRLIEEHRLDLKKTAAEEKCLSRTLDQSLEREVALRLEHRPELPSPQLNAQEIKRLDDNSVALRDKQMLHLVDESLESQFGQTQVARKNLAARAIGRALAADISVKDLTLRIDQFPYIRQFYPVLIKDADGAEKTASLNDLRPRSLTEKALSYFSAKDRFEINVINQTLDEHHADLLSQRDLLDQFAKVTRASAQDYGESLLTLDQPLPLPQTSMTTPLPQFTLRELSHLENFAAQQSDAAVRAQFENIIVSSMFGSAFNEFTSFSRNIDLGFDLTQMAASDSAHLRFQKDDNLEANTNTIEKVSVESAVDQVTVNEAAVTVETDAVSETWAELL